MSAPRHVLVTGAAGGIGGAVGDLLEADGVMVSRTDLRAAAGILPCDVSDRRAVEALLNDIEQRRGVLTGLAHTAARCGGAGPFHDVTEADWQSFIDVNLGGTFHVCQAFAKRLISRGAPGRIAVVGSVNALAAEHEASPYAASKGGMRMLVKAMAADLGAHGITANLVHPGPITVPRNEDLFSGSDLKALFAQHVPVGRAGEPADVARIVRFLLDPANGFVNGAELTVDGGLTARILAPPTSESPNGT